MNANLLCISSYTSFDSYLCNKSVFPFQLRIKLKFDHKYFYHVYMYKLSDIRHSAYVISLQFMYDSENLQVKGKIINCTTDQGSYLYIPKSASKNFIIQICYVSG